jgi:O-antigen ligase
VTAAVSVGRWFAEVRRRRWVSPRPVVALVVSILIAASLFPEIRRLPVLAIDRWVSEASAISNRERIRYLTTAASFVQEHPISGIGLERFGPAYLEAHQLPRGPDDPHNAYLMVAAELGIPALGCYLFLLFTALITAFGNSVIDPDDAPTRLALAASIVAILVLQLFSTEPLSSRVCWVTLALALTPLPGASAPAAAVMRTVR